MRQTGADHGYWRSPWSGWSTLSLMWPVETAAVEMAFIWLCQQNSKGMIKYKRVSWGGGETFSPQLGEIALAAE